MITIRLNFKNSYSTSLKIFSTRTLDKSDTLKSRLIVPRLYKTSVILQTMPI